MTDLIPLFPNQTVPPQRVDLAGGAQFDLASEKPFNFTLIVFYRGLHCPICKIQLKDLESQRDEFETGGAPLGAVPTVSRDRDDRVHRPAKGLHEPGRRVHAHVASSGATDGRKPRARRPPRIQSDADSATKTTRHPPPPPPRGHAPMP